jgi:hypothetical protein
MVAENSISNMTIAPSNESWKYLLCQAVAKNYFAVSRQQRRKKSRFVDPLEKWSFTYLIYFDARFSRQIKLDDYTKDEHLTAEFFHLFFYSQLGS